MPEARGLRELVTQSSLHPLESIACVEVEPSSFAQPTPSKHLDSNRSCYHDASMRTTVTLDPDVQQLLRDAMQRRRLSFKEALNQAIRSGLSRTPNPSDGEAPFVVRARRMGLRAGIDAGRLNQMTDELEAESFDELSRTLSRTLAESAHKQK